MNERGPATVVARIAVVLLVAVVLQTTLVSDLRVFGVAGDVMLLVAIAAGLAGGPDRGAACGFAAGIAYDLLLTTPFGLSALTYCIVGYAVGAMHGSVLRATRWIPITAAVVASGLGVILYIVLGEVVGQDFGFSGAPRIVLVVAAVNALLVLLATRALRWALGSGTPQLGSVLR